MHTIHMSALRLSREDFELVVAIKEKESLTQAAEFLHLSQSALSHHLRGLETRLGDSLFQRLPRKMMPTALGEEFAAIGKRMVLSFQSAEQQILARAHSLPKILRLATQCYTSYSWLPALIQQQNQEADTTELQIVMEATPRVTEALVEGEIDIAILNAPVEDERLECWPLFRDEIVLIVSPQHPFAGMRRVSAEELAGEIVLSHTPLGTRTAVLDDFLIPAKVKPKSLRHVPLTEAIVEMVSAGLGVAPFARWLIAPYLATHDLRLVPLGPHGIHREWQLAARKVDTRKRDFARLAKMLRCAVRRQIAEKVNSRPV